MPDDTPEDPSLSGQIKAKLTGAREKGAQDARAITGRPDMGHVSRLPPGQKLVTNWPVLDLGVQPDVKPEKWRLRITGLVENPAVWTLEQFKALPLFEDVSDIHCVTT